MSQIESTSGPGISWPSNGVSEVPYAVYTDPAQYDREQERLFQGPAWHYLCLEAELAKPGDFVSTTVGETAVVVCRDRTGNINAFVNRCIHRGNLICLERQGNARKFSCIYHGWTYDHTGKLAGVAFERGVNGQGGMAPEFRKEEQALRRLRTAVLGGIVFGTFSDATPDLETWLGPDITRGLLRVMNRKPYVLGRNTQVLPNNWKLYFENVKDSYHASILHLFFTTFRINRLTQDGGIYVNRDGGSHYAYVMLDYAAEDAEYRKAALRSDSDFQLQDRSVIDSVDEYGDGVSLQILSIFPGMVLQQVRNTIAVRVVRPRGVGKTELEWIHLGFEDDDEAMTERRLRQGNLIGASGYISMEDGCVGGFVQRGINYNDDGVSIVMMGGHEAESQNFRASEAAIRGFWKQYRSLMGA